MTPLKEKLPQEAANDPAVPSADPPTALAIWPPDERHLLDPLKKMGFRIVFLNEVQK